jgi:hypothetical protein
VAGCPAAASQSSKCRCASRSCATCCGCCKPDRRASGERTVEHGFRSRGTGPAPCCHARSDASRSSNSLVAVGANDSHHGELAPRLITKASSSLLGDPCFCGCQESIHWLSVARARPACWATAPILLPIDTDWSRFGSRFRSPTPSDRSTVARNILFCCFLI